MTKNAWYQAASLSFTVVIPSVSAMLKLEDGETRKKGKTKASGVIMATQELLRKVLLSAQCVVHPDSARSLIQKESIPMSGFEI